MVNLPRSHTKVRRIHKVKQVHRTSKKRSFPRNIFLFFCFLVILLLGFFIFESRNSLWSGQNRVNFVFKTKDLVVVSLNPEDKSALLMALPDNLMMKTAYGYGDYQVGALQRLETLEKRDGLIAETIRENFNIGIEGWIVPENSCVTSTKEEVANCLKSKTLQGFFKRDTQTNFTRLDLLRIWWLSSKIKAKDINSFSFTEKILKDSKLADGSPIKLLNSEQFQIKIDKLFWDSQIKSEGLSVKVINSSFYQGLGEKAAKILENSGMDVVSVENGEEESGSCQVESFEGNRESKTLIKIKELFNCQFKVKDNEDEAQITVIIGRNFGQQFLKEN